MFASIALGVVGVTSRNFTRDVARGRGDNVDTNFAKGCPLKKLEGQKTSKIRRDFRQLSTLTALSPERIDITKIGKAFYQLQPFPYWVQELGELWFTNKKL